MAVRRLVQRVQRFERQMTTVEQFLPTLATKADLLAMNADLEARLATKDELRATKTDLEAAMARLATTVEVKTEETRRHFDVVAENLHGDIRLIVEGLLAGEARSDGKHAATHATLAEHDRRLTRLEASASKRR